MKDPTEVQSLGLLQVLGTEEGMLDPVMGTAWWAGLALVGSVNPSVCGVSRVFIHL